jgi:hypothetical protein
MLVKLEDGLLQEAIQLVKIICKKSRAIAGPFPDIFLSGKPPEQTRPILKQVVKLLLHRQQLHIEN